MKDQIIKLTKPSLEYFCKDVDSIEQSGFLQLGTRMEVEELDEYKLVEFDFKFRVLEGNESNLISKIEDTNEVDEYINAKYDVTYRVVLDTEKEIEDIKKNYVLNLLEAYIQKDILDFYKEVGLPVIRIPSDFWSEE